MLNKFKKLASQINIKQVVIFLFIITAISLIRRSGNPIQEDNYIGYALSLNNKLENLLYYDHRLLPGFPIMIYFINFIFNNPYISAYFIVYIFSSLSLILTCLITNSKDNLLIFLFPPIMLDIATKITNEYVTLFLILLSVFYFIKGKYNLSSFISGLGMWIRPIGVLLFPSLLISLYLYKRERINIKLFLSFITPIAFLMLYNRMFFNTFSPFYQLAVYNEVSPYGNSIGFFQIIADIVRSFKWGQFPIFFSGLLYLGLFIVGIYLTLKNRFLFVKSEHIFIILSGLLMILYIFSYSFSPFLENFARYITPLIILWWILFRNRITNLRYFYFLIPLSFIMAIK